MNGAFDEEAVVPVLPIRLEERPSALVVLSFGERTMDRADVHCA